MSPTLHVTSASGLALFYARPNRDTIRIRDIAAQLARINRWVGAAETPISVAQHSVHVAELLEDDGDYHLALYGLLHDAHEYMMGDQPRDLKAYVTLRAGTDILGELADTIDKQIHAALGIDWPPSNAARTLVKRADDILAVSEFRDLMPDAICPWQHVRPLRRTIKAWSWPAAEEKFLAKYADLCALTGTPNQLEKV